MNEIGIGHNRGPSPGEDLDQRIKAIEEGEIGTWLDGVPVETDAQLEAVDGFLAIIKGVQKEAEAAREEEFRPLKKASDDKSAEWKPRLEAIKRLRTGLLALCETYKVKVREEQEAEQRKLQQDAWQKQREAENLHAKTNMANLEERKVADDAALEARQAGQQASAAKQGFTKGLRKEKYPEITNPKAFINWIREHDRPAMVAFMEDYARRNFRNVSMAGVEVKERRVAQ